MEIWEIVARLKIREAVEKNFFLYDHDRFVEAYSTYAEDGVLEPAPGQQTRNGRADILARFALREDGRLGDYGYVRHNLTTQYIEAISPDEAEAYSYYFVYLDGTLATSGVFHDRFVQIDGEWLVKHRRVLQDVANVPAPKHL